MTASVAGAHPGKGKAYGLDREPICHNGKTLYLPEPAIAAHLKNHDDAPGPCSDEIEAPAAGGIGALGMTKAGDLVLKTTSADTLKLDLPKKTQKQEKRLLKSLKGNQIEVKGELRGKGKNKTLQVTSIVKMSKGKR